MKLLLNFNRYAHLLKMILIFFLLALIVPAKGQIKAKIVGVKDGDTVVALMENRQQITLRLAEVDCPEKGQPFGKNAKQFTSDLVFGKQIVFYPTATDRYKRTVARIYLGKIYLSEEIIKQGYGWWFREYSGNNALGRMEALARKSKRGLWVDAHAVAPWEFRKNKRKKYKRAG